MIRCENDSALGPNLLDGAATSATRWREGGATTLWWEPVLTLSAKAAGVRSRDDSQPGDEPLFSAREWISIGVGAIPGVGSGQSVVDVITGRDPITGDDVHPSVAAGIFAGVVPGGRWQSDKGACDVNGIVVGPNTNAAHIPLEDFRFIPPELLPDPPK